MNITIEVGRNLAGLIGFALIILAWAVLFRKD